MERERGLMTRRWRCGGDLHAWHLNYFFLHNLIGTTIRLLGGFLALAINSVFFLVVVVSNRSGKLRQSRIKIELRISIIAGQERGGKQLLFSERFVRLGACRTDMENISDARYSVVASKGGFVSGT